MHAYDAPRAGSSGLGRLRRIPAVLILLALADLFGGGYCLWLHNTEPQPTPFRAAAGIWFLLLGLVQLRMALHVWHASPDNERLRFLRRRLFWRWLLVALICCYALSLLCGEREGGVYIFWATLAACVTLAQFPLVMSSQNLQRIASLVDLRPLHVAGWALYFSVMTPLCVELTLRVYSWAQGDSIRGSYLARQLKLPPGREVRGLAVNAQGYWDKEFAADLKPGVFRVAAIGDDLTLCGTPHTNFLAQIERRVPGVEIYNFGLPQAGPREYAAQVSHEIVRYRPDLVITFVSVGSDIIQQTPQPGLFDCRGLRLVQFGALMLPGPSNLLNCDRLGLNCDDYQTYLNRCSAQLAVCRTPINAHMHQRWRATLGHLSVMAERCRRANIPVALVVTPGEFQVNRTLLQVLTRRAGYEANQIDLELPQRRLAAYAKDHDLRMLDLLPHLRAACRAPFERNDHQLSEEGNAVVADVVGHWMQSHFGNLIAASVRQ